MGEGFGRADGSAILERTTGRRDNRVGQKHSLCETRSVERFIRRRMAEGQGAVHTRNMVETGIRSELIGGISAQATGWRRKLHQNPQTMYEEVFAGDFIAGKLTEWGIAHERGVAKTGIV